MQKDYNQLILHFAIFIYVYLAHSFKACIVLKCKRLCKRKLEAQLKAQDTSLLIYLLKCQHLFAWKNRHVLMIDITLSFIGLQLS